jgi:hypothetical protein
LQNFSGNAAFFSPDYATARQRFREAVGRLQLPLESHVIAARGPQGEPLSIEVATLGPADSRRVLILSSGLHGVEGFFGSAVQLAWLAQWASAAELPKAVKVVLVHALNPFGFAWLRRGNENNVDLNRNFLGARDFLDGPEYGQSLAAYENFASFLNPPGRPAVCEPYALKAVARIFAAGWAARRQLSEHRRPIRPGLAAIWRLGLAELQKTLPVGQYRYRDGLFYGGEQTQESVAWLQAHLPGWVAGAELTLQLDFHSGLGAWADYQLHVVDQQGSPRASWVAENFGEAQVEARLGEAAYGAHGTMAAYFRDRSVGGVFHGLTAEFGTYSGLRVLGALRAENQAHRYADPASASYRRAKHRLREAFVPAAPEWRDAVVTKSLALIGRAIAVCADAAPAAAGDDAPSP